ncbi:hypothetical protein ACH5RR_019879 [Cinchona calisaya]|uniref:Uncharacterized protein n=1 Tax=Cinchona calisaya TaxID=153742 RepID=A0ABD2ZU74_9GENT
MGGCASKPKDLDTQEAPAPVENPQDKAQETSETKTEEPLVDLSEEAPKVEEAAAAETTKPVEEAAAASSEEEKEEAKPESITEEATNSVEEKKAEEPEIKEDEKDTEAAAPKPQDN